MYLRRIYNLLVTPFGSTAAAGTSSSRGPNCRSSASSVGTFWNGTEWWRPPSRPRRGSAGGRLARPARDWLRCWRWSLCGTGDRGQTLRRRQRPRWSAAVIKFKHTVSVFRLEWRRTFFPFPFRVNCDGSGCVRLCLEPFLLTSSLLAAEKSLSMLRWRQWYLLFL